MDIVNFLIQVFPSVFAIVRPGPIQKAFNILSQTSSIVLFGWHTGYRESELDTLRNPSSQVPRFGIFSQSSVRTYSLLEDASVFHSAIDDEDVLQSCNEIQDVILEDL